MIRDPSTVGRVGRRNEPSSLAAAGRASNLKRQGQSVNLVPDRERSHVSSAHRHHPAAVVEERFNDSMDSYQYPGSDLSISKLCHALRIKLVQTRDSR